MSIMCVIVMMVIFTYVKDDSIPVYSVESNVNKSSHYTISNNFSSVPSPIPAIDNSKIPIVDYGYVNGIYIGPQRNPISVAHKANDDYLSFKEYPNYIEAKQSLINNANWLVDNAARRGNYSILEYKFPWPPYGLKPPWYSAMAQGQAIQALIKAHQVTWDKKYLDAAKMLLNSFFIEVKDGGVTEKTTTNGWWYEEYASKSAANESRVLNGMIFALLGIHEYYNYTHDSNAKNLFEKGVKALKIDLPLYDYHNRYTYYDRLGNLSPVGYHKAVIESLGPLYDITKEQIFKTYLDKWKNFKIPSEVSR
jgi:heparosan-N-sulfate-glucuronate 5-epimerase